MVAHLHAPAKLATLVAEVAPGLRSASMVRLKLSACSLVVLLASPFTSSLAAAAPTPPATTATSATPTSTAPAARVAKKPAPVQVDWRARVAIVVKEMQTQDPQRLERIEKMQPVRAVDDELAFVNQPDLQDPRAAGVLLRRLFQGADAVKVRCAIVDALPQTGGEWQEGAAALAGIDPSPLVRKKLVQSMRYAVAPHAVNGLKLGFKDEDPEVNIAAARTAAFSRVGPELYTELYSSTFDNDWDLRAAAVQALGMLKLPKSRDVLVKALHDEEREVRLQALLALEQLDPEGLMLLPELEELARDKKSHRIARKAELLLRKRRTAERLAAKAKRKQARERATSPGELMPVKSAANDLKHGTQAKQATPAGIAGKTAAP